MGELVLVRHGRSAHVHAGWINRDGFLRWRAAYEAAGIATDDAPPPPLVELTARAGAIVASDAARAIESAQRLGARDVIATPLVRELELTPPNLRGIRLPLLGWALAIGVQLLLRRASDESQRVAEAADWLLALADEHQRVVAVTHASFRAALARELVRRGAVATVPPKRSRHWSAWIFATASRLHP